jgi:hypothetical protein
MANLETGNPLGGRIDHAEIVRGATLAAGLARDEHIVMPAPAEAKLTNTDLRRLTPAGAKLVNGWRFHDAQERLLGCVARFERPGQRKEFRPIVYTVDATGKGGWTSKGFPEPRPLYGLDRLAKSPDALVIVVEGEGKVQRAGKFYPGAVVIASSGGAMAAAKTDWSPLNGCHVVIWPDNDKAGRDYARDVARLAYAAGAASVRIVTVPDRAPEGWDLGDDLAEAGLTSTDVRRLIDKAPLVEATAAPTRVAAVLPEDRGDASNGPAWDNPDLSLLAVNQRPAPTFDVDVFGPVWTEWAIEQATAASAPIDYVACALLAAVGASVANVRWPIAGANWTEPPLLWCGLVGSPSAGKSPAMSASLDLVHASEDRMAEGFDDARRAYETAKRVAEAAREEWEIAIKVALKDGQKPPPMPATAEAPDEPVRPRLMTMDISTEKLACQAAALPRGLLRTYDELSGWFASFGRYGGGGSDRSFAIQMYGGRYYLVERKNAPNAIQIRHLSIGVLGGIQPDKLAEALVGPDDGLPARFLWCWPEKLPAFTLSRERVSTVAAKAAFARLVELPMGSDEFGNPEPVRLPLDHLAENLLEEFARRLASRAADAYGVFAGTLGKARGHVLRLSAVLELMWWAAESEGMAPTSISNGAVGDAIDLVEAYFLPMAERVFGDAATPVADRNATMLARHLRRARDVTFNARLVRRTIGGALRDGQAMDAACAALVEAGLIRHVVVPNAGAGRKPKDYQVNPALLGGE